MLLMRVLETSLVVFHLKSQRDTLQKELQGKISEIQAA